MCSCLHPGLSPPPRDLIPAASHPPAPNAHQLLFPRLAPGPGPGPGTSPSPAHSLHHPRQRLQLQPRAAAGMEVFPEADSQRAPDPRDENLRAHRAPGRFRFRLQPARGNAQRSPGRGWVGPSEQDLSQRLSSWPTLSLSCSLNSAPSQKLT